MRWSDKQGGRERLQTNMDRGEGELSGGHPAAITISVGCSRHCGINLAYTQSMVADKLREEICVRSLNGMILIAPEAKSDTKVAAEKCDVLLENTVAGWDRGPGVEG
jgi:hypothetical protein